MRRLVVCGLRGSGWGDSRRGTLWREGGDSGVVYRVCWVWEVEMTSRWVAKCEKKSCRRELVKVSSKRVANSRFNDCVCRVMEAPRYPAMIDQEVKRKSRMQGNQKDSPGLLTKCAWF
jgi:hypothetical protein